MKKILTVFLCLMFIFTLGCKSSETQQNSDILEQQQACLDGHNFEITEYVEPTCQTEGHKFFKCKKCSSELQDIIPKVKCNDAILGNKKVNCFEDGYDYSECSWCHTKTITKTYPALNHDFPESNSANTSTRCRLCGIGSSLFKFEHLYFYRNQYRNGYVTGNLVLDRDYSKEYEYEIPETLPIGYLNKHKIYIRLLAKGMNGCADENEIFNVESTGTNFYYYLHYDTQSVSLVINYSDNDKYYRGENNPYKGTILYSNITV